MFESHTHSHTAAAARSMINVYVFVRKYTYENNVTVDGYEAYNTENCCQKKSQIHLNLNEL